jgi:hypothetical protein
MPAGPGKYHDEAQALRRQVQAESLVVIVTNGVKGSGFEIQADFDFLVVLPDVLRHVAREIEQSLARGDHWQVEVEDKT